MFSINSDLVDSNFEINILLISEKGETIQKFSEDFESKKKSFQELNSKVEVLNTAPKSIKDNIPDFHKNSYAILVCNSDAEVIWYGVDIECDSLTELMLQFLRNYFEIVTGLNLFKWGNKIPVQGEYMCSDCGYILTVDDYSQYRVGDVFPSCEVCEAGSPDNPTDPSTAFWQLV